MGLSHHAGSNRTELDIPRGGRQVVVVDHERGEPPLPQVAAPTFAEVDPPRVRPMGLADRPTETLGVRGDRDQVDVVGHQAIRPDLHAALAAPLGRQLEIGVIIVLLEEGLLPAVPALRHVVRIARNNNSCDACHAGNLVKTRQAVKRKLGWCPRTPSPLNRWSDLHRPLVAEPHRSRTGATREYRNTPRNTFEVVGACKCVQSATLP